MKTYLNRLSRFSGNLLVVLMAAACLPGLMWRTAPPAPVSDRLEFDVTAGNTISINLALAEGITPESVIWTVLDVPIGIETHSVAYPTPWQNRLVVTSDVTLTPDDYTFGVSAAYDDQIVRWQVKLNVSACVPAESGTYSADFEDNQVEIISAGKPALERGLLIPVQICQPSRLTVTVAEVISETGTVLHQPPFYLYHSLVSPAPESIYAHAGGGAWQRNVNLPRVDGQGMTLTSDVTPGLHLLVFEQDRYPFTKEADQRPAWITYRLEIKN